MARKYSKRTPRLRFPQFHHLPPELRQRIFYFALPCPRELKLDFDYQPKRGCRPPGLLRVNNEARRVAQNHYRLLLLPVQGSLMKQRYIAECHDNNLDPALHHLSNQWHVSLEAKGQWEGQRPFKAVYVSATEGFDKIFLRHQVDGRTLPWPSQQVVPRGGGVWNLEVRPGGTVEWGERSLRFLRKVFSVKSCYRGTVTPRVARRYPIPGREPYGLRSRWFVGAGAAS